MTVAISVWSIVRAIAEYWIVDPIVQKVTLFE
jgi:hypothetical protein